MIVCLRAAVCFLLLAVRVMFAGVCSSFAVRRLLFVVCWLFLVSVGCLLFWFLWRVVCGSSLVAVCCSLMVCCSLLCAVGCDVFEC